VHPPESDHAVFVSYADEDCAAATAICGGLEVAGIKCWIAPRDARGEFAVAIDNAIRQSSVFLLVLSSASNRSSFVRSEVAVAGACDLPMIPVRIEDVQPEAGISLHVSRWQWFEGLPNLVDQVGDLAVVTRDLIRSPRTREVVGEGPGPKSWAWWGGRRSTAEASVTSVLAIAETILAMVLYGWIAWRWGTLHLTIASCVTPFLLLRTAASTELGVRWTARVVEAFRVERTEHALLFLSPLLFPLIRFLSTLLVVVRHPLKSLGEVPRNWWHSCCEVDSGQLPEIVPGVRDHGLLSIPIDTERNLGDLLRAVTLRELRSRPWIGKGSLDLYGDIWSLLFLYAPFLVVLSAIAVLYRFSVKGTAAVWSPIIWTVRRAFRPTLVAALRELRTLALHRVVRNWSLIVLGLLLAKSIVFQLGPGVTGECRGWVRADVCENVVVPGAFPAWQIAAAFNAILAWVLYLLADGALHAMRNGRLPYEGFLDGLFKASRVVRGILSSYTIACSIYLAAYLSRAWDFPPLGTKLWPW
jgi:hypothetical protein